MTAHTPGASTKECRVSGGVLIIENVAVGDRKKSDIIREIVGCLDKPDGLKAGERGN